MVKIFPPANRMINAATEPDKGFLGNSYPNNNIAKIIRIRPIMNFVNSFAIT